MKATSKQISLINDICIKLNIANYYEADYEYSKNFINLHVTAYIKLLPYNDVLPSEKQRNTIKFIECNINHLYFYEYKKFDDITLTKSNMINCFGGGSMAAAYIFIGLYRDVAEKNYNDFGYLHKNRKITEANEFYDFVCEHSQPSDYNIPNH